MMRGRKRKEGMKKNRKEKRVKNFTTTGKKKTKGKKRETLEQ